MNFKLAFVCAACVLVGFYFGTLLSQENQNPHLPPNVYGLPLSEFWKIVLKETGASNESALNWFYAETDESGNLKHLILEFSEVADCKPCRTYHVEYVNGRLRYYSIEAENVRSALHPLTLFNELEKLDFRRVLQDHYYGLVIDAEMESGKVRYDSNHTKIYLLLNGTLIPL